MELARKTCGVVCSVSAALRGAGVGADCNGRHRHRCLAPAAADGLRCAKPTADCLQFQRRSGERALDKQQALKHCDLPPHSNSSEKKKNACLNQSPRSFSHLSVVARHRFRHEIERRGFAQPGNGSSQNRSRRMPWNPLMPPLLRLRRVQL